MTTKALARHSRLRPSAETRLHLRQAMDAYCYSLIKAGAIRRGRSGETEVDETAKTVVQRLLAILAVDRRHLQARGGLGTRSR